MKDDTACTGGIAFTYEHARRLKVTGQIHTETVQ